MSAPPARAQLTPQGTTGDQPWIAFEHFVREQYPALCAYAHRYLRSRDAAEEVVQDVLLRVWMRRDQLPEPELTPYVYGAIANASISRLRSDKAMLTRDLHLARSTEDSASSQPEIDDITDRVRQAIEELPERTRVVFLLSRDAGLTYPAIAARLGIAPKTVENQIVRALRHLRAALKPYLSLSLALSAAQQVVRKLL